MEKENLKKNTQIFTYVYKHEFEKVVELLRDFIKMNMLSHEVIENYATQTKITKGKNSWQVGAEFSFVWKNFVTLYLRSEEYFVSAGYAKCKWFIYNTDPPTPGYYLTFFFYKDVTKIFTTFVMELNYETNIYCEDEEAINRERHIIFERYDRYLKETSKDKVQEERIELKSELTSIWKIVLDMKRFRDLVPYLCDAVEYEGDMKIGSEMIFKWVSNKSESIAFVEVKDIFESDDECVLLLECRKGFPRSPNQDIIWKLNKIDNSGVEVKFIHKYKDVIDNSVLKAASKLKQKILHTLKNKLELEKILSEL